MRSRCWFCFSLLPLSLAQCVLMSGRGKFIFQQPLTRGNLQLLSLTAWGFNLHLPCPKDKEFSLKSTENSHRFILRMIFLGMGIFLGYSWQCPVPGNCWESRNPPRLSEQQVLGQGERGTASLPALLDERNGDGFREMLLTSESVLTSCQGKAVGTALTSRTRHRTDPNLSQPAHSITVCVSCS